MVQWCLYVHSSVWHFWWKLIDRNFLNPIFNTNVILRASPFYCSFHCFARDYLQTGYSDMLDISYLFNNSSLKSVLMPKYSLSIRNKCAYLLESSKLVLPSGVKNTPKIAIFRMCYGENGTVKFFETLADNVFGHRVTQVYTLK